MTPVQSPTQVKVVAPAQPKIALEPQFTAPAAAEVTLQELHHGSFAIHVERTTTPSRSAGHPSLAKEGIGERTGLRVRRTWTRPDVHPYDQIEWERRDATITNDKGEIVFQQQAVEVPKSWSQTATNIVVQKYFRGKIGTPGREQSVRQMVDRVAKTIAQWGREGGYFATAEDAASYEAELTYLLVNQHAAFNSPVWFNVGIEEHPQCSACFINSVQDSMRSILQLAVTEGMLFKYGSGTGTNLSSLRGSKEHLRNSDGKSSGPVSFMKGYDAFAGVIKSGGKTRRAAKMVILNIDHPDVVEFINCKAKEEQKAWALIGIGYDGSLNGEAYSSVFFQNSNNSVRVTDDFMQAVLEDKEWQTRAVTSGEPVDTYRARDLMGQIAQAAWQCGDPGLQYDTTINRWHPCPNTARINASNPCSEYMFLDDSACNLASLNLMKFRRADGEFDTEAFKRGCEIIITAQEIVVDNSSYPTRAIAQNSHDFRPLGIGYANLGALLMAKGLPYDSEAGRNFAAAITAVLSGQSYRRSAEIAESLGTFNGYAVNRDPFLRVINMHRDAAYQIKGDGVPSDLLTAARQCWDETYQLGQQAGFRNAQISVLAPTGTIAFLMDCDTTGVEPDIALVKYKWLVGGGLIKIVNQTVPEALRHLGYAEVQVKEILAYIDQHDTIEGAPSLREEHLPVFDCAFKPQNGQRSIHYLGHIRMMAAVQPFLSGAISKTVNMPNSATPPEIAEVYTLGWKLGLKAIAIYRDGCKQAQPLVTSTKKSEDGLAKVEAPEVKRDPRRRLPAERQSITHKFAIGSHEGYITVGLYDDGVPGEVFIKMSKEGSVISGLMDSFATSVSIALQYGVPLPVLVNKFVHVRFEPSGYTQHPQIRIAKSIVDYLFRWLALKFLDDDDRRAVGLNGLSVVEEGAADHLEQAPAKAAAPADDAKGGEPVGVQQALPTNSVGRPRRVAPTGEQTAPATAVAAYAVSQANVKMTFDAQSDAPACDTCGAMMVRNAACYKCLNCGNTSGCS